MKIFRRWGIKDEARVKQFVTFLLLYVTKDRANNFSSVSCHRLLHTQSLCTRIVHSTVYLFPKPKLGGVNYMILNSSLFQSGLISTC